MKIPKVVIRTGKARKDRSEPVKRGRTYQNRLSEEGQIRTGKARKDRSEPVKRRRTDQNRQSEGQTIECQKNKDNWTNKYQRELH